VVPFWTWTIHQFLDQSVVKKEEELKG